MSRVRKVIICLLVSLVMFGSVCVPVRAESPYKNRETIMLIDEYIKDIIGYCRLSGLFPSVVLAQMIREVGYDLSVLAKEHNNLFGVRWSDSFAEDYPGSYYVEGNWAHFASYSDSIAQHNVIWWNGMYPGVLEVIYDLNSTTDDLIDAIEESPYCVDAKANGYGDAMRHFAEVNEFYKYDEIAFPDGRKYAGYLDNTVGEYSYPDDGYNLDDVEGVAEKVVDENGNTVLKVKEEDLVGMYPKSIITEGVKDIELPNIDSLSTSEKMSLYAIRDSILESNRWDVWKMLRVFVVFIGLVILSYGVLFFVAWQFDKVNTVLEISLIGVITLGSMKYSEEYGGRGYVNGRRLFQIECALYGVGFFLVGGSLFSILLELMYRFNSVL